MRQAVLSALVSLVTAQIGLCEQSVARDRSVVLYQESAPAPNGPPRDAPARPASDRADEISELKGAVLQLQQRVDQLTPSSASNLIDPPRAEAPCKAES